MAQSFISSQLSLNGIDITNALIIIDSSDHEGIHIAASHLSEDFKRATGTANAVVSKSNNSQSIPTAIIIGSLDRSTTIQHLVSDGKLNATSVQGKWETFTTTIINNGFNSTSIGNNTSIQRALVIAGSDKRGTIFGIYTLSEQIGVSPWYWWADVPTPRVAKLYARDVTTMNGPPSVKYRGIFLNDEAPSLTGWAREKFGGYNKEFYEHVFELLLRLKANFMWPAMWSGYPHPTAFFVDDPENRKLADKMGVVVGTSHHEPMQRAMNEWFFAPYNQPDGSWSWSKNKVKITQYFDEGASRAKPYESYITLGMRGGSDGKIDAADPKATLGEILKVQRGIIREKYGAEDKPMQLLALYKEVQEYWEDGLEVPEDITLLFADDNFGSIRRLPTAEEAKRKGRAGIYYHLEYVGSPRSYKWLNSNSLGRVWQQLRYAYQRQADQIWVFNVGDLKPMEVPISFAMGMAWDVEAFEEPEAIPRFLGSMLERQFGERVARNIGGLLMEYNRLMALRKHEHIEPSTFSLLNYREADIVLANWTSLLERAEKLHENAGSEQRPALFQLVLHSIKASYINTALRITQARNRQYAQQRRNSANTFAKEALELFDRDFDLQEEYHGLLNGRWNHIMRQPHYGYTNTWHAPSRDMIDGLAYVQTRSESNPIVGFMGTWAINEESDRTHPSRRDLVPGVTMQPMERYGEDKRWFEIFSRGTKAFTWTVSANVSWIKIEPAQGTIATDDKDARAEVGIDWANVPDGFDKEVLISVRSDAGDFEQLHLNVSNRRVPDTFTGFVESNRYVSIEAAHFRSKPEGYEILPYTGRTESGSVSLSHPRSESVDNIPFLEYPVFIFGSGKRKAVITLNFTMTLDTDPTRPMSYDLAIDELQPTRHRLVPEPSTAGELPSGWSGSVMNGVWGRQHDVEMEGGNAHEIKIRLREENMILEKVIVDLGGLRESYLGPPESRFVGEKLKFGEVEIGSGTGE
ncbi:glycoside hydrolase family 115 protein [Zopfia rhizophila CBS 207.26]|uniref:Glycoside hydrolase family 115 protein n=1 Tax=Zopfia rhizophila CBS 207.26 TaxID=1314779 RepID=A0A6A6EPB0_9PEZI|nr:glycoside hydrolase family 115 protein [Zopfia rhizophila CBS 207.26]